MIYGEWDINVMFEFYKLLRWKRLKISAASVFIISSYYKILHLQDFLYQKSDVALILRNETEIRRTF